MHSLHSTLKHVVVGVLAAAAPVAVAVVAAATGTHSQHPSGSWHLHNHPLSPGQRGCRSGSP